MWYDALHFGLSLVPGRAGRSQGTAWPPNEHTRSTDSENSGLHISETDRYVSVESGIRSRFKSCMKTDSRLSHAIGAEAIRKHVVSFAELSANLLPSSGLGDEVKRS
ncbi:unnamed protein product [Nesidiocoris tenuis]|uniref:Uncharacterized protein n=1 Tax=Nesidiocoris tenuis TaxID=355587 RepID=A0A6H5FVT5_9HEMI|nr:unnamed protein product [Nesidiocoris tenuis]